ncbi:MAG: hypothetical protein GY866_41925 [Proteobacteria bacterium]|nr:hypothetical protein [Pseudomonadota bacterium]
MVLEGTELDGVDDQDSFYHVVCIGGLEGVTADMPFMDALGKAKSQGSFYSSAGPEFKTIYIEQGNRVVAETSPILHARLIGPAKEGKWKADIDKKKTTATNFRIPEDWAFARLEIEDEFGRKAWSNPLVRK